MNGVMTISKLLLDEPPLQVMPTLAKLIGLNEAIVLQQIHYWLKHNEKDKQNFIDGHYWVYNTYEQWHEQFPFWSIMTIRRTMTKLENMGLLIAGNYNKAGFDKTKWYSINYNVLNNLFSSSVQNEHIVCSDCNYGTVQNEQTYTRDYTETTTEKLKVLKGSAPKHSTATSRKPFDWSILEKQIIKSCHKLGIQDCSDYIEIIRCYYLAYMSKFHQEHPRLSSKAMDSVIDALQSGSDMVDDMDPETYAELIEQHFRTQYDDCDYNICHFMTEGIRNYRFFETCY